MATAEDVKKTETSESAEGAEYRALVDKAELGAIFAATIEHRLTDGAEAELQAHLEIAAESGSAWHAHRGAGRYAGSGQYGRNRATCCLPQCSPTASARF